MDQIIESLRQMRQYEDHPGKFWPAFLELTTRLARARTGMLLIQGQEVGTWKKRGIWPPEDHHLIEFPALNSVIEQVAEASVASRCSRNSARINGSTKADITVMGLHLEVDNDVRAYVAIFLIEEMNAAVVEQTAELLKLVADTPASYQQRRAARQAMNDIGRLSGTLELMVLLNAEKRYLAAAMTFVNEVASRYHCPRASLGWIEGGYVRLQAISHMERFDKKMEMVQELEVVMEEAFDQNEEVLLPPPGQSTAVVRDHETFSRNHGSQFMVSLPLRQDDVPSGVLTCERSEKPFSEAELSGLRVLCDQAAQRLDDLKKNDRWFLTRIADTVRKGAARLLGVEHTLAKAMGLLVSGALVFLLVGAMVYRVQSPFVLRSDYVKYLPAPFDGYIDKVNVKVGEQVKEGDILLTLSTRDLLLEESAVLSNQIRYSRDAQKARAEDKLAEMKIAMAQADQAEAQLDLVRHHLSRAEVKAPFSGFVVEGDLEELQGAAVTKGKILFKVARLEKMYAELEVSERNIQDLTEGMSGKIAFVSRPNLKFPITVERIDPVAVAKKDQGNVFLVRCSFPEKMAGWWRPGMGGVAKITVGKRNALWILTHRTIDFLRMRLWW